MKSERGSILIIMTLVLVVTAIYMSTALFDIRGSVDQERLFKTKKHLSYLEIAVSDFRVNNPTVQLTDLANLVTQPVGFPNCDLTYNTSYKSMQYPTGWCGPYIDTSLFLGTSTAYKEDAWGTAYQISSTGSSGSYRYVINSCGENLTCGDGDDIPLEEF